MSAKSPSKFYSMEKLKEIKNSEYCDLDRSIDYVPDEVDEILLKKINDKNYKDHLKYIRQRELAEKNLKREAGLSYCTGHKKWLPNSEFSPRADRVGEYKSKCKQCRNNHNKTLRFFKDVPF